MATIEIVPLAPPDGSEGHAFSIRVDGTPKLLLDAGSGPGGSQWVADATAHDLVWLSHGHSDHAGALPALIENNPRIEVVLPAAAVAPAKRMAITSGLPEARVHAIYDNATAVKFHRSFELGPFTARTAPSGHGCGSGLLRLELGSAALGYTGDWAIHARLGVPAVDASLLESLDLLIMESALAGAARLDAWDPTEEVSRLRDFLDVAGPRLAVVSPFAEADEVISELAPLDPIVHDGLRDHVDAETFATTTVCAQYLDDDRLVVVPGEAMRAQDPSGFLALPHVTGPRVRIALFNRVPRDTPAAILLATQRRARRRVYGQNRRIRAHIERFDLPTHARRVDVLDLVKRLLPLRLLLFHDREEALHDLRRSLQTHGLDAEVAASATPVTIESA